MPVPGGAGVVVPVPGAVLVDAIVACGNVAGALSFAVLEQAEQTIAVVELGHQRLLGQASLLAANQ